MITTRMLSDIRDYILKNIKYIRIYINGRWIEYNNIYGISENNNKVVGIIDFGDVAITDRDKDFVYLLENSEEEIGRKFGLKVLEHYNHPNKEIAILKAGLNDEYYPIELILGGESKGMKDMIDEGLNRLENL